MLTEGYLKVDLLGAGRMGLRIDVSFWLGRWSFTTTSQELYLEAFLTGARYRANEHLWRFPISLELNLSVGNCSAVTLVLQYVNAVMRLPHRKIEVREP